VWYSLGEGREHGVVGMASPTLLTWAGVGRRAGKALTKGMRIEVGHEPSRVKSEAVPVERGCCVQQMSGGPAGGTGLKTKWQCAGAAASSGDGRSSGGKVQVRCRPPLAMVIQRCCSMPVRA
jgi:hypothetical protein